MATVTVKINGIEYNLKGEANDDYLKHVAEYVEGKLKDISNKNAKLSTTAAAVLTAINVVDELFKGNKDYNELLSDYDNLRIEKKSLVKDIEELKSKLKELEEREEIEASKALEEDVSKINNLEEENIKFKEQIDLLTKECKATVAKNKRLTESNKEMKFNNQTLKYKVMDLQKKYVDSQIIIAKERVNKNPLLNINKAQ
ncbi:cell division protein ZapA [Clostridium cavendishii]|nr:cell division protein ZapA [Clostridium cavendishii]